MHNFNAMKLNYFTADLLGYILLLVTYQKKNYVEAFINADL